MSEDSLHIEFVSKELKQSGKKEIFENIYRKYVSEEETESSESSIKYRGIKGDKASYYAGFFDTDLSNIDRLIQELEMAGASDVIASAWYDSVGEKMFYARISGEFLQFERRDEIGAHINALSKKPLNLSINYRKKTLNNTFLVRLHIKVKSKRKKIYDLFEEARNLASQQDYSSFTDGFSKLVKSSTHEIAWCKFKWKNDKSWNEVAPKEIIYALVDVVEEDEYLYLAFDIDKISTDGEFELDDYVYFVLFNLDGVKKIWIKFRPSDETQSEFYLYHPGMGDESFFFERGLSNDNQWPK